MIEFGVPFSDPIADGPTIQRSSQRALVNGTTLEHVLELTSEIRDQTEIPFVLFSYFNPILQRGVSRFCVEAAKAGIDGVLITDLVGFEATGVSAELVSAGIDPISLIAPTTTDERLEYICNRLMVSFMR